MADGKIKKGQAGLTIRFEILNLLFRNPQISIKIPSARELAEKFNLARSTVVLELEKLANDGYLIGKRGSGTYTNPKMLEESQYFPKKSIVGLMVGDSRRFFLGYSEWGLQSHFGLNICQTLGAPRILTLSSPDNPETSVKEIATSGVDALVWIYPDTDLPYEKIMEALFAKGMPVLSVFGERGKIPKIMTDHKKTGREIAKILLEENRTRIIWQFADRYRLTGIQFEGAKEYFKEQGKEIDTHWNEPDIPKFFANLEERLAAGDVPEAIVCHGANYLEPIRKLLARYGVDEKTQCRLITKFYEVPKGSDFYGLMEMEPIEELAQLGTKLLLAQFAGENVPGLTELQEKVIKHY